MDQLSNEPSKRRAGGDKRTPQAKEDIAKREQQIVALRLRHHSFTAIGRAVGVTKQSARTAFNKALRRNTDQDIQTVHRSELAELDAEASAAWELTDTKDSPKACAAGLAALNRIHIRRAHLLGLDAPTKLEVSGIYQRGGADAARAAESPGNCHRRAFGAPGRSPTLVGRDFRMAPTHRGGALASVTDHYHRQLLSGDHLHHRLLGWIGHQFERVLAHDAL
jgi:hypothetical protein